MATNYARGTAFERRRREHYESIGYTVTRSAGSKGAVDLIAYKPKGRILMIQCKRVETMGEYLKLRDRFKESPPLPPGEHYLQMLDVYITKIRRTVSTVVAE